MIGYEQNPNPALVGKTNNSIPSKMFGIDVKVLVASTLIIMFLAKFIKK